MAALPPFQALLDDHGRAIWRFLRASLGEHDAADCYQETVLAALRAYPDLRRVTNLKGWLFTIAHHKALDHHRRVARRRQSDREPPEQPMVDEPTDESLWAAVHRLPPKQRAAVLHRFVADLPYADIATLLGCSEPAARQNVRAGLAALRADLAVATEGATP